MTTINEVVEQAYELAQRKGWGDPPPTFGEAMALGMSEFAEALDAYRENGLEDMTARLELVTQERPKPEGVGSELADVLIRLGHYCKLFGIDLQAEYDRKMAYNETRPRRHGDKLL